MLEVELVADQLMEFSFSRVPGTVADWLERLGYGAKVAGVCEVKPGLGPSGDWKTLSAKQ